MDFQNLDISKQELMIIIGSLALAADVLSDQEQDGIGEVNSSNMDKLRHKLFKLLNSELLRNT